MIKLKKLLQESSPGFENRKFGDPLPTLADVKEAKRLKESKLPTFSKLSDVSDYGHKWGINFGEMENIDFGPRESDMYDWNDRRHYEEVKKEFHAYMVKIAMRLNSTVHDMENAYKTWDKILKKHRSKDKR